MKRPLIFVSVLPLSLNLFAAAQDTRIVTEPVMPGICITIDAQLQTSGHTLAEADEAKLDTVRIQKASTTAARAWASCCELRGL